MRIFILLTFLFSTFLPSFAQYGNNNYYGSNLGVPNYGSNFGATNTYVNPYANLNRVNVDGYYRSNGAYVQPYVRTAPNNVQYDNLRYKPRY